MHIESEKGIICAAIKQSIADMHKGSDIMYDLCLTD